MNHQFNVFLNKTIQNHAAGTGGAFNSHPSKPVMNYFSAPAAKWQDIPFFKYVVFNLTVMCQTKILM